MRAIVETIQRDQDLIIRNLDADLLMIQGVAGSGKTAIALHRAAFLMYEGLANKLASTDILILSPNRTFSSYIAGVLPELGEDNVRTLTFDELLHDILGDDMRIEALRQTNYVKSIVTAQGQMDLERKGKQSYQGWIYARLLAFSNGDLQALYDRSDGFYRRQLVLTTRDKPADRADDPNIAEKMAAEAEGIFLWAFEGLRRLVRNDFKFTESDRARRNRELVKRDSNNFFDFMEAEDYIRLKADACIRSKDLYAIYKMWCEENNLVPLKARSFSDNLIANLKKYNLEHTNNIVNSAGRRVWGYLGIEALVRPEMPTSSWG